MTKLTLADIAMCVLTTIIALELGVVAWQGSAAAPPVPPTPIPAPLPPVVPPPPPVVAASPLATAAKDYVTTLTGTYRQLADGVRGGTVNTQAEIVAAMTAHNKPHYDALTAALAAAVDASGNITAAGRGPLADAFAAAAKSTGGP